MTAVIIGSAVVLVVAIVAVLAGRAARARSDRRFEAALGRLDEHMSAISDNLQRAVERAVEAQEKGVGDLELTLNLDDLVERTLAEAVARTAGDAAALRVEGPGDAPLTASFGAVYGNTLLETTLGPPDARPFRALTIDWTYGPALEDHADTYKSALVVPIVEEGVATGAIAAFAKAPHAFRAEQARALQTLTDEVAPGIANARRFARAEQRAVTDELTGVRNRKGYEAELKREVARARRTGRPLSLLVLDLNDTSEPTARSDASEPELELRALASLLTRVTRATDILCRRDPTEFAILLPETDTAGAQRFFSRVRREVAASMFTQGAPTMLSAGLVDWRPHETSESLDARVLSAVTRVTGEDVSEPRAAAQRSERATEQVGDAEPDTTDPPSPLGTRRTFLDRLAREVVLAHRDGGPLTLLVLDVSNFRSLSGRLGERGANRVLAEVATRLGSGTSNGWVSCRTREDELAVLLPQTTADDAERVISALQTSLNERPPEGIDPLVVSAGITELTTTDDPGSVFGRAEQALWQARQAGEGTVIVATANGDPRRS